MRFVVSIIAFIMLVTPAAIAQYPVVSAQDVLSRMSGKKKALLIDTRSPEEYRETHISGAINIPAEQIKAKAGILPKDKAKPLIFYCRGTG